MTPLEGIDVSAYQGEVDWCAVRGSGVSFVYGRAEIGLATPDRSFHHDMVEAGAAGLLRGAYLYAYVRRLGEQDAGHQMRALLADHKAAGCELRPMIDCEPDGNGSTTRDEWVAAVRQARDVCKAELGCAPFFYSFAPFIRSLGSLPPDLAEMPLWIASYTPGQPSAVAPWTRLAMWQYAGGAGVVGHVPGVRGQCDRDRFFGTVDDLRVAPCPDADPADSLIS